MDLQLLCLAVVAVCSAQGVLSSSKSRAIRFPAKLTSTGGVCPAEEQRVETRRQIMNETLLILNRGLTEDNPASSCSTIPAGNPSGYYWIQPATGPPAVQVYCDFNRQCGCDGPSTWTRIAFLNMSDPNQDCPDNWFNYSSPVRACGRGHDRGCNSVTYSTHGLFYNRVCGRVLGYQNQFNYAFFGLIGFSASIIDEPYLDGVSLTHGSAGSRQHIWSFASAAGEPAQGPSFNFRVDVLCDCSNSDPWPFNTSFVGNDYFCDAGNEGHLQTRFYSEEPLWDGDGCGLNSTCCQFNNPPWFCKTLPQPTTDDLEVRACNTIFRGQTDVPVELIELYIQ